MYILIIISILIIVLLSGFRIAKEHQQAVVFNLGRFKTVKGPGLYWIIPFIERQQLVDLRTKTVKLVQQETLTKDSVNIKVNAALWFKITNPEDAVIKVSGYNRAVYQFLVKALQNIIGQHSLDEVLKEREKININVQKIVNAATQTFGINIEMVQIKDIEIPNSMQQAMAYKAEAIKDKGIPIVKVESDLEDSLKLKLGVKEMDDSPITYREKAIKRIKLIKKIVITLIFTLIILSVLSLVFTFTLQTDDTSFFLLSIQVIPLVVIALILFGLSKFLNKYIAILQQLSEQDLLELEELSKHLSWTERYLPSFILSKNKLIYFKFYIQPEIDLMNLTVVTIKELTFTRSPQNILIILENYQGKKNRFAVTNKYYLLNYLKQKLNDINPKIIINDERQR